MTITMKHLQALLILGAVSASSAYADNSNQESSISWSVANAYENFYLRSIRSSFGQTLKFVCGNNTFDEFLRDYGAGDIVAKAINETEGSIKIETKGRKIGLVAFSDKGKNFLGFHDEIIEGTYKTQNIFVVKYDPSLNLWVATAELTSRTTSRAISPDDWINEPESDGRNSMKCDS